jgi:tetratricopeptide (TPR) repeat protein
LWNQQIKDQPASAVKTMCEDYIGGIYFKRGEYEKAILHYSHTMENSDSFWWCIDNQTKIKSDMGRIKILYKYQPSSPELAVMVQAICREAEDLANQKVFERQSDTYEFKHFLKNRKRYIELRDFALQVVSEKRTDNPAMWQYAAAFLTFLDGKHQLSNQYIDQAEELKGTPFIKNNIKILKLMITAYTGNYDADFEYIILPQLQCLDKMICTHIKEGISEGYNDLSMFYNYSIYYYNDMMRKITLSVMLPNYLKRNQKTKALLLAGMASERLRSLLHVRQNKYKYTWDEQRNIDFYTDVFDWMNTLPIINVIEYKQQLQSGGDTAFERFLAAKCYKNDDYLNEIIGTKYLRLEQFDKAVEYLSKVSKKYAKTLNIYEYFYHDPFREPHRWRGYEKPYPDYKLNFAIRMLDLQRTKEVVQNKELEAEATFQYAWGLIQATTDCWALIDYDWDNGRAWQKSMALHAEKGMQRVMNLSSNDELKAKCVIVNVWLADDDWYDNKYVNGNWTKIENPKSVVNKNFNLLLTQYVATDVFRRLYSECDNFLSYCEKKGVILH